MLQLRSGEDLGLAPDPGLAQPTSMATLPCCFVPPDVLAIEVDPANDTTIITYQSMPGVSFQVTGGTDLPPTAPLEATPIGSGAILQYLHSPPGRPQRYFYEFSR